MLRDEFALRLIDPRTIPAPGATGADRTHILALWVGPARGDVVLGRAPAPRSSPALRATRAATGGIARSC